MTLEEFVAQVPHFADTSHADKIKLFGWFLHAHSNQARFDAAALRACYDAIHAPQPTNLNPYLKALTDKKPPELLRDRDGYRLEGRVRAALDQRYGQSQRTVAIGKLLAELPSKVPAVAEQVFLNETLVCYRHAAFRAAIVMAWNLAYSHLLDWILGDAPRLGAFNARIPIRFPKRQGVTVANRTDFEVFKESEVLEIASSAGLYSKNIAKILDEKLTRRNIAAHPSTVVISEPQAEDVITDLVNNVVLALR